MPFENHICWKPELIHAVMDTEALQTDDHYFLATHYPAEMRRVQRGSLEGSGRTIRERDLLKEFLNPERRHVNTVILGSTGSGKSHLIRWLHNNIEKTQDRNVVLIPKANTNLREIIRSLLSGMTGPEYDEFRARLETATASLTPTLARELLHKNLIVAIGEQGPFSRDKIDDQREKEEREYIIANLPALFSTPTFAKVLSREGGVLDDFSNRIVGKLGRERRDKPLEFSMDDLKLDAWDIRDQDLDSDARCIYADLRANVSFRQKAVDWLNKNVEWAVSRVLNLDSSDLGNLMLSLRETLARQNKELIILMEDFSRSQGIDGQLLDALLVSPEQAGRTLCVLRWAIAVTTGYYNNRFEDTARERIDLLVNMDVPEAREQEDAISRVTCFATLYLNAVRSEEEVLRKWHKTAQEFSGAEPLPVPSACDQCPHRDTCHSVFGQVEGLGLYPFTEQALRRMYRSAAKDHRLFNPRDLINEVLRNALIYSNEAIQKGDFPPKALLADFGGAKMPAINRQKVRDMVPTDKFEQYRTLIELWGDPEQLSGISPGMFESFGLKPLEMKSPPKTEQVPVKKAEQVSIAGDTPRPKELQDSLDELNSWSNGGYLSQSLSDRLRERLFDHIRSFIDWDTEMLVEAFYVGPSRAFQRMSINFKRQPTQVGKPQVRLELPLDDDFTSISLALQGILLHEHHHVWNFKNGNRHLLSFVACVEAASREVLSQVRQLRTEAVQWDPVPAATELLVIGAKLRGTLSVEADHGEQKVNSLLMRWNEYSDDHPVQHSGDWQRLLNAYGQLGASVTDILMSRIACTKGGQLKAQIIDASVIIDTVEETTRTWQPRTNVPGDVRDDYKDIWRLRKAVDQWLEKAIAEERQLYLDWHDKMKKHIATDGSQNELIEILKDLVKTAFELGFLHKNQIAHIEQCANEFENADMQDVLAAIMDLGKCSDTYGSLRFLGVGDHLRVMRTVDALIAAISDLLALIEHGIDVRKQSMATNGNILDLHKEIGVQLTEIHEITDTIGVGHHDIG